MRVLLVKTSSMGDVIHTFPALTDLSVAFKGQELIVDWVVEEGFVALAKLHPLVNEVIPVAIRRWRKAPLKKQHRSEFSALRKRLKATDYDIVLDAQGLVKSAFIASLATGKRVGYDRKSMREPLAALSYNETYAVSRERHAIDRVRSLFSSVFNYSLPQRELDYGLLSGQSQNPKQVIFIHSTSWESKHLPESHWVALAKLAAKDGYHVLLPWYSAAERERAERIQRESGCGELLPKLSLDGLAKVIADTGLTVGTDTGLSHLAAAYNIPGVVIYGSTSAGLTGVTGPKQRSFQMDYECAPCLKRQCVRPLDDGVVPCYNTLTPNEIWAQALALAQT